MEWRLIKTAPRDGTSVLLSNGKKVWEDWFCNLGQHGEMVWMYDDHWADHDKATHWMPLPPPPEEASCES